MTGQDTIQQVLIYDDTCGFCTWWIRFVLAHERERSLRFAPLNSRFAVRVFERYPELRDVDSVVWVQLDATGTPVDARIRSSALLKIVRYLGGWWSLLFVLAAVPRPVRDWAYDLVAVSRHRLAGRAGCPTVRPDIRGRLIDD